MRQLLGSSHLQSWIAVTAAALISSSAGCVTQEPTGGNPELGIARFEVQESAVSTTVHGFAADGHELARVELVHGQFTLSPQFQDDYPGQSEIDGRRLDVTIDGQRHLFWEVAGYEPTLELPAHPASEVQLAALLQDPHVAPLLQRWQIGFRQAALPDEAPYSGGYEPGYNGTWCYGLGPQPYQCGTARGGLAIGQCGGTVQAYSSSRTTRSVAAGYSYDEYIVAQYCPAYSGGQGSSPWFGIKACPTTGTSGSTPMSSCGTVAANNACRSCPGYPAAVWAGNAVPDGGGISWCSETQAEAADCYYSNQGSYCYESLPAWDTCACTCSCIPSEYEWYLNCTPPY